MIILFEQTKHTKYYISEEGEFFSATTYHSDGKLHKRKTNVNKKRGYVYARTTSGNYQVHRMVASAFIHNPDNKSTVNHKNGDKTDNKVSNLEWSTQKENNNHAISIGLSKKMKKNEGNIKYTNEQCKKVLDRIKSGMTYLQAGSIYNMPYSTIAHLVRGSRRKI
jgi:hypothetical protein